MRGTTVDVNSVEITRVVALVPSLWKVGTGVFYWYGRYVCKGAVADTSAVGAINRPLRDYGWKVGLAGGMKRGSGAITKQASE